MVVFRAILLLLLVAAQCLGFQTRGTSSSREVRNGHLRGVRSSSDAVATNIEGGRKRSSYSNSKLIKGAIEAELRSLKIIDCTINDLPEIMRLSYDQFEDTCSTEKDRADLKAEIQGLFLPKMVFSPFMGHRIIGLQKETSKELVGFVDLSLQPQSLEALKPLPVVLRAIKHGKNLKPYLCNLLVSPEYRRKGLGKKLVNECINTSAEWGYKELFLHVKESTTAPLNLYKSMGFKSCIPRESYATLLRKEI